MQTSRFPVSFLLSRIFPDQEVLLEAALALAAEIASKSPVAVQGTKINLLYSRDHSVAEGLNYMVRFSYLTHQSPSRVPRPANQDTAAFCRPCLLIGALLAAFLLVQLKSACIFSFPRCGFYPEILEHEHAANQGRH